MKTKHTTHNRIFGVFISDGDIISQFIFLHGLRPNTEFCLEEVVLIWIDRVVAGEHYV